MFRSWILAVAVLLSGTGLQAAETVGVSGSSVVYQTPVEITVGGKQVNLVLTGTALRKKLIFKVYAIGSYVLEGSNVHSAEDLITTDSPKQLRLVMERDVEGKDMAEAFRSAVRLNHAAPEFNSEVDKLAAFLEDHSVSDGDQIWFTHVPGVGLNCNLVGKGEVMIENVNFSRAFWEIYLGPNNLGDGIKKGLVSRQ